MVNFTRWSKQHFGVFISLWLCLFSSQAEHLASPQPPMSPADGQRLIKLDHNGNTVTNSIDAGKYSTWECVLDTQTALVWEVKTTSGIRGGQNTYSWYNTDTKSNGGMSGYKNGGLCANSLCDTKSYIQAVNQLKLCGFSEWRLPDREELRSIVDYRLPSPGPVIDRHFFPNTYSQFYWSATADANDTDSAWGIGFTFGYDYSYFKSDAGYVRLVTHYQPSDNRE